MDWYDDFMELIRRLYIAMGGDPAQLNTRGGVEAAMAVVADYYANSDVSPPSATELADAVHSIYPLLADAPPTVDPAAVSDFRDVLVSIWTSLGRDPADLEH
jgi:hypothetical protein